MGLVWLGLSGVVCVAVRASTSAAGDSNGLITFMSARSGGDAVWVMHVDGSGQTRLTRTLDPAWDGFPAFSPDGRRIAYTCGNFEICVMNADGSDPVRITRNPWPRHAVVDSVPTWSPDGTRIAFDRDKHGLDDLYVVNIDGSGLHRLTYGSYDEDAAWSPDGTRIAFDGLDRAGINQIFVVNADGSGRRQLTASASSFSETPAWSPDSQQIVYMRAQLPFGAYHVWVMKSDGTGDYALTSGPWDQESPAWSPDGQLIAYWSDEGYQQNIWTVTAAGTGQAQLTHGGGFNITPSWQPVLSPSPASPPPPTATTRPSRPTPEARLVAIFIKAEGVLYDDVSSVPQASPVAALTIGSRLITDAAMSRRQTLVIAPSTKWGKKFKHRALAIYASAHTAGNKFNAAIGNALTGHAGLARREAQAALRDILTVFSQEGQLAAVL